MNVLFVINSLDIGGAETFLLRLLKEFDRTKKVKTYLFLLNPEKNDRSFTNYFLKESSTTLIPHFVGDGPLKRWMLYRINGLYKRVTGKTFYEESLKKREELFYRDLFLKDLKIDLINSHLYSSDLFAATKFKPLLNLPLVVTMQGCYNDFYKAEDLENAKLIIEQANGFTYVSAKNLTIFSKTGTNKGLNAQLVYNSLPRTDKDSIARDNSKQFIVGQVSRTIETKGMEIAIQAVNLLVKATEDQNIKLQLFGPESEHYNYLQDKYKNFKEVEFKGPIMNPIDAVRNFDIGILPTYFPGESCPSTIVEYLSCGIPVLTTDIGEIPDMLSCDEGKAGIMVKEKVDDKPSVQGFYEGLQYYYDHPEARISDGNSALNAFKKFEIGNAAKQYLEVYQNALSK